MKNLVLLFFVLFLASCSKNVDDVKVHSSVVPTMLGAVDLENRIFIHTATFENYQERSSIAIQGRFVSDTGEKPHKVETFKVNGHDIPFDNLKRYSETFGGGYLSTEGMLNSTFNVKVVDRGKSFSTDILNEPFPHVTLSQDPSAVSRNQPLKITWEPTVNQRSPTSEKAGAYVAHRGTIDYNGSEAEQLMKYTYVKEITELGLFEIPASELQKFPANSKLEIKMAKILNFDDEGANEGANIGLSMLKSISIVIQLY